MQVPPTAPPKLPPDRRPRPPGSGRKARLRRRRDARNRGSSAAAAAATTAPPPLLSAPWLHGNTAPGRLRLLDGALRCIGAPLFRRNDDGDEGGREEGLFGGDDATGPATPTGEEAENDDENRKAAAARVVVAVDVGVGDSPSTTLELAAALRPDVCGAVIGTEVDRVRLDSARRRQTYPSQLSTASTDQQHHHRRRRQDPPVDFRHGTTDFALPLNNHPYEEDKRYYYYEEEERPHLIRAMNVLRDYHVRDACVALHKLYGQLSPGGMLVEGSCDSGGDLVVALVLRKEELLRGGGETRDGDGDCPSDGAAAAVAVVEEEEGDGDDTNRRRLLYVDAVIFAADLDAMDCGRRGGKEVQQEDGGRIGSDLPSSSFAVPPPPASWFVRHLPRIWRGCCCDGPGADDDEGAGGENSDAIIDGTSSSRRMPWADPVRDFMVAWGEAAGTAGTATATVGTVEAPSVGGGGGNGEVCRREGACSGSSSSARERFVGSARALAERMDERSDGGGGGGGGGAVLLDWSERGILVWRPGRRELRVPPPTDIAPLSTV